uniref:Headcase N-terminal domain-containing protein n=1 Tax=Ditylenchus dipsaci TaxID=166011 RepID=A0A915D6M8_9BILA
MAVRMKKDRIKKNVAKSVDLFGGSSKSMTVAKEDGRVHCMIPMIACIKRGEPLPTSVQNQGVKMCCTNSKCQFASQFVHADCFKQLENTLIKIISNLGSARGWTDIQRRNNLWEKKGLTLVQKNLRCECGLGLMTRDADFYKVKALLRYLIKIKYVTELDENGTATPVEIKGKKKKKKELPKLNYTNNGAIPVDNAEIYKKKYSDADCHYRDDSFDDGNMSIASTDTGLGWQKSNGLQFETPKRSAQLKNHQVGNNCVQLPMLHCDQSGIDLIYIGNSSFGLEDCSIGCSCCCDNTNKEKLSTTTSGNKEQWHHLPANNDPESLPEISPPIVNSQRKASTPTLPLASWTSIVQSSLVPATVELPVNTSNFNQRKQQQREFAASIAGQCGSMAGSARNILVYTLFGNNAPSFLLGERIMANFYLPKRSFC